MADRTPGTSQETERTQAATRQPEVREQARDVGAQVQERAQEAGRAARDWAQETGNKLREGAQEGRQQMGEVASRVSELSRTAMNQFGETLEDRIRHKPLQSILVAAGIGMLVGLLWKR